VRVCGIKRVHVQSVDTLCLCMCVCMWVGLSTSIHPSIHPSSQAYVISQCTHVCLRYGVLMSVWSDVSFLKAVSQSVTRAGRQAGRQTGRQTGRHAKRTEGWQGTTWHGTERHALEVHKVTLSSQSGRPCVPPTIPSIHPSSRSLQFPSSSLWVT